MKKDMYGYFIEAYPQKASVHELLFDIIPSDAAFEMFTSAVGLGKLLRKPEDADFKADAPMESYTIMCKNETFGRVVSFSYESVQDSQKIANFVQSQVATWARGYQVTREEEFSNIFNYGAYTAGHHDTFNNSIAGVTPAIDASGDFIYDGQPFFSTAHPDRVGNTYSNFESSRTLSAANLKLSYLTFTTTNNRDERGLIMNLTPTAMVVNPALRFTAQEILNSSLIPNSQDNTTNVLSSIVSVIEWPYISGTDDWILGVPKMGLMGTEREMPSLDMWQDELNLSYFCSIRARFGRAVTNWRYWMGHNLATS